MKKAVYLDRDGVINEITIEKGVACSPRRGVDFKIKDGVVEQIDRLKMAGFLVIVVTNQPDIARGKMPNAELDYMTQIIRSSLAVDDVVICPHDDADACACRKPKPGMLLQSAAQHGVDPSASFLVGDTWKDVAAAQAAECAGCLLLDTCYNQEVEGAVRVAGLAEAVDYILLNG